MTGESETNQYVKAWQCIGCGKIEAPQTCVGICQDRKVEFVYSFQHDETLARLANARAQRDALAALLRRLACTTPRNGDWEGAFRTFQEDAWRSLAALRGDTANVAGGHGVTLMAR